MEGNDMSTKLRAISLVTLAVFSMTAFSGCAAGRFHLTRAVGGWNNRMPLLPRILVYVAFVIIPVYGVTLLADFLVTNTIDFWSGTSTASNASYERDGVKYAVVNRKDPLKHTIITAQAPNKLPQVIEFKEQASGKIALWIDGVQRAEVSDLNEMNSQLKIYSQDGITLASQHTLTPEFIATMDEKLLGIAPSATLVSCR
jgi:hypothetical protein